MAINMSDLGWMAELCPPERQNISKPGTVVIDGVTYAMATNGMAAVLIAGASPFDESPVAGSISGMIKSLPTPRGRLSLAELRAFLGNYASATPEPCEECQGTRRTPCDECDGSGEVECTCSRCDHEHEAPCDACDGSGYVDCDCQGLADSRIDPFLLDTVPFDRKLVARWIRHLPDGEVQAVLVEREGWAQRPCALVGEGWILLIMPCRHDDGTQPPRFALDTTQAPAGAGRGA